MMRYVLLKKLKYVSRSFDSRLRFLVSVATPQRALRTFAPEHSNIVHGRIFLVPFTTQTITHRERSDTTGPTAVVTA